VKRKSIADAVFEATALAILEGRWASGDPFPPERVVAEEFDCSRVVARQAIHRLADLGLLKVKQGAGTVVLGVDNADIRLIEVLMKLSDRLGDYQEDLDQHELLYGVGPLTVCAARASDSQRVELARIAREADDDTLGEAFWGAIVEAGGNRIYRMEILWWSRIEAEAPVKDALPIGMRRLFYTKLADAMVAREDPVPIYLNTVRGVLGLGP